MSTSEGELRAQGASSDEAEKVSEPDPTPSVPPRPAAQEPSRDSRPLLELVLTESTAPSAPEGGVGWKLPDATEPRVQHPKKAARAEPKEARVTRIPLAPDEARTLGGLVAATFLHGLVFAALGSIAVWRWSQSSGAVFEAVAGVVAAAFGLWSFLAAFHLRRVVVRDDDDAGHLSAAFGNLRSLFILKGIGLFLMLAVSCFTFSVAAMLLAP